MHPACGTANSVILARMDERLATERPHHVPPRRRGCTRSGAAILAGCSLAWLTLLPYILVRPPKSGICWLVLLLITPPAWFAADVLGEKLSGSWGEGHPVLKFLKAVLFVMTGVVIVVVVATCSSIFQR